MSSAGLEGLARPGVVLVLALAGCGGGASALAPPDEPVSIEGAVTSLRPFVARKEDCVPRSDLPPDAPVASDEPPGCDELPTDRVGALRVEKYPDRQVDEPGALSGADKAVVSVGTNTRILRQTAGGFAGATFDDLGTGQQVAVWFNGPVAESHPVQATAATIVIRTSG